MPRDCEHGQLARSCERCEDAREIAALTLALHKVRAEYRVLLAVVKARNPNDPVLSGLDTACAEEGA